MISCRDINNVNRYLHQCIKISPSSFDVHMADLNYIAYKYCELQNLSFDEKFKKQIIGLCELQSNHITVLSELWNIPESYIRGNCKKLLD